MVESQTPNRKIEIFTVLMNNKNKTYIQLITTIIFPNIPIYLEYQQMVIKEISPWTSKTTLKLRAAKGRATVGLHKELCIID